MGRTNVLVLFILVSLTWGTTWLAMRVAVDTIPPLFATGMRFIFSAPFLITIAWVRKTPLLFPKGQRLFQLVISIFYFSIPFSLMIYGEIYVSAGVASIIFSNMPVAVLIASIVVLNEKVNAIQLGGLLTAVVSLMLILVSEMKENTEYEWHGIFALGAAVVIHAIIYAQCKKRSNTISVITFNALPVFFAGIALSCTGWLVEKPMIEKFSPQSILSTLYLGVFAGVFGILCYFALQKKASPFHASLVFLIFPLIAVSLDKYLYGYGISMTSLFLIIPLIIGIFITISCQHIASDTNK